MRTAKRALATRTEGFTESVIREMTRLNAVHSGINLAQGFPNFAAPAALKALEIVDNAGRIVAIELLAHWAVEQAHLLIRDGRELGLPDGCGRGGASMTQRKRAAREQGVPDEAAARQIAHRKASSWPFAQHITACSDASKLPEHCAVRIRI